jgi:hypothetical protein
LMMSITRPIEMNIISPNNASGILLKVAIKVAINDVQINNTKLVTIRTIPSIVFFLTCSCQLSQ